jgi:hypothetical protein
VYPLTIAAPVLPGRIRALRRLCARDPSPLDGIPDTHFARVVLIPPRMTDVGQRRPDRLASYYVLVTSDHDGEPREYVETLRRRWTAVDELFGVCAAYPGARDRFGFHDWIERHSLRTLYYVNGYSPRRVDDINALVRMRTDVAGRLESTPASRRRRRA